MEVLRAKTRCWTESAMRRPAEVTARLIGRRSVAAEEYPGKRGDEVCSGVDTADAVVAGVGDEKVADSVECDG